MNLLEPRIVLALLAATLAASVGGGAAGITTRRYLIGPHPTHEIFFGITATTACGVISLGYLYVFFLRYPIASIPLPERVFSQTLIFVAFFLAAGVGVWAYPRSNTRI